jgi:hypothetical protein
MIYPTEFHGRTGLDLGNCSQAVLLTKVKYILGDSKTTGVALQSTNRRRGVDPIGTVVAVMCKTPVLNSDFQVP